MNNFLDQYGKAIFTLVIIVILIAFASPLGIKVKNTTTDKVSQTEQIGKDEITAAMGKNDDSETGGPVRPEEPAEAVDQVYCIYYYDDEMTISQNEIEPEIGKTVVKKGFYYSPQSCTRQMTTVRFIGAVKPKNCEQWFTGCSNLKEIKNIENLYTNECTSMYQMFTMCSSLANLDLSGFDTSKVTNMNSMFYMCTSLTSIGNVSNWNTNKVTIMSSMFFYCSNLLNLDITNWNVVNCANMFAGCNKLSVKSVKVSRASYDTLNTSYCGISADKFDIVK